jgi:hypothetical protein
MVKRKRTNNDLQNQGSPHIVKTGRLDFSLRWSERKSGRLLKSYQNFKVSFPTTACPSTIHKTNVLHNDLKKHAINELRIKYWTSNPVWVKFQEHRILREYWRKSMIGRFHWNKGEKVAHFAWYGEPCKTYT